MDQKRLTEYYNHLQSKKTLKSPRVAEFFNGKHVGEFYDCKNRNYLVQNVVVQHLTVMKNCVNVHMFDRVVRYFTSAYKDHSTVKRWQWRRIVFEQLFDRENSVDVLNEEVQSFLHVFDVDSDFFRYDREREWWSRISFLHKLGVWFSKNGLRLFSLFPVYKPGLKHLQYNGMALYELLRATIKLNNSNVVSLAIDVLLVAVFRLVYEKSIRRIRSRRQRDQTAQGTYEFRFFFYDERHVRLYSCIGIVTKG